MKPYFFVTLNNIVLLYFSERINIMTNQESPELLKKCDMEVKKCITAIKNLLEPMQDPDFKLMVIESKDQLKQYEEMLKAKLAALSDTEKDESPIAQVMSKAITNTKLLLEKTDQHIAALIFDECNTCLKELYKALNAQSCCEKDSKEIAQGIINTLTDLREKLVAYL